VESGIAYVRPSPENLSVSENDPASTVMTDFNEIAPVTIEPDANLANALQKMKERGIRLLMVTNDQDRIIGVITAYDIQSEKPIQYGAENNIAVNEIDVSMLMTPLEQTPAFDFKFVEQSLVRHVVHTMKELNRPHTLVIEMKDQQYIRGVFSTSRISRLLGRPVYHPPPTCGTFFCGNSTRD
jgi:signal-transduction protein with cAMP-binding, CBS, and nucleotidyltransferase domain